MNMHIPPSGPQRAPLAAFPSLPAPTAPRPPLSAVLDALRAEDEQTRRDTARLAEVIAGIAGIAPLPGRLGVSCVSRTPTVPLKSEGSRKLHDRANRVDIDAVEGIGRSAARL